LTKCDGGGLDPARAPLGVDRGVVPGSKGSVRKTLER